MPPYPKRKLNPEFVQAVRTAPITRHVLAHLAGYGPYYTNLNRDLSRPDGTPFTPTVRERMSMLAVLVGFPVEQVWLP